jgi:hypothetical protein
VITDAAHMAQGIILDAIPSKFVGYLMLSVQLDGALTRRCSGFSATTGWDPVTGLGTPNFDRLLKAVGL